jgi:nitrogen fixation NifU-like protein
MYNKKTIDHFSNPRNMGELKKFDAKATGGNPACGDVVDLYVKFSPDKKKINHIKFKAFGCGMCIASTSAMTEMVMGKKVDYALKLTRDDIAKYLGGIPENKNICSNFSIEVLHQALKNGT